VTKHRVTQTAELRIEFRIAGAEAVEFGHHGRRFILVAHQVVREPRIAGLVAGHRMHDFLLGVLVRRQ
jgi:hypothetical protein